MPRVFYVTLTKEFDIPILANSESELLALLDDARYDIDDWEPPQWEFSVRDNRRLYVKAELVPSKLQEFEMAAVGDELVSSDERGETGNKIKEMVAAATQELADLKLKLGLEKVQCKLPF